MAATNAKPFQSQVDTRAPAKGRATNPETTFSLQAVDQYMIAAVSDMGATPAQEAALYHLHTGGHRMRSRLALASGATRLNNTDSIAAAAACELLHNASLVHDDITDGDLYRRGSLTVRSRSGTGVALCTGDLLMTAAFNAATDLSDAAASQRLVRTMARTASRVIGGQSIELADDAIGQVPNRRDYLVATRAKTAPLIELPLSVGLADAPSDGFNPRVCREIAEAIGLAYQILDDLDDLRQDTSESPAPALHALHAWWHHQRPGAGAEPLVVQQRCLAHVRAALSRADRLARALPEPLMGCVAGLIESLERKAERKPVALDGATRR